MSKGKEVPGGVGLEQGSCRAALLRQSGDAAVKRELRVADRAVATMDLKLREEYASRDALEDQLRELARANDTDAILHLIRELAEAPARETR